MEQTHTERAHTKHCRSDSVVVQKYTMAKRAFLLARDITPRQSEKLHKEQTEFKKTEPDCASSKLSYHTTFGPF